jgi:hypothetical protein
LPLANQVRLTPTGAHKLAITAKAGWLLPRIYLDSMSVETPAADAADTLDSCRSTTCFILVDSSPRELSTEFILFFMAECPQKSKINQQIKELMPQMSARQTLNKNLLLPDKNICANLVSDTGKRP